MIQKPQVDLDRKGDPTHDSSNPVKSTTNVALFLLQGVSRKNKYYLMFHMIPITQLQYFSTTSNLGYESSTINFIHFKI